MYNNSFIKTNELLNITNLDKNRDDGCSTTTKEIPKEYNPYMNNEGTVLGFKGTDYIILGGDTRLSTGYSILSRDSTKLFQLTEKVFLASGGMYADIIALVKNLKIRIELYKSANNYEPEVENISQLLSTLLYYKRFFPYYAFNILAGVNSKGELKLYGYDAIGSFDCLEYASQGSGKEIVMPILDSLLKDNQPKPDLEKGYKLALTAMNSCSNRDIYTGDSMDIVIIYSNGRIEKRKSELRKD